MSRGQSGESALPLITFQEELSAGRTTASELRMAGLRLIQGGYRV
ncbi:hypothetical protein OG528_38510 [Streptomyces platensis]